VLTVAVSIAGGTAAIISAFNGLAEYRVAMCVGFIILMTVANLRGLRESGALFAPPTYLYIASLVLLIVVGLYRVYVKDLPPIEHVGEAKELIEQQGAITLFFFLKAFASGAVALSGVEAVSNGVPTFQKPESKNASNTLIMMAVILGTCFFGISMLAKEIEPVKDHEGLINDTVLAQMAEHVYGGRNVLFFITQFATFAILILAANTAYAGYPALSSIIAKDNYLPRQFANRGTKLVFSNGIIFLSVMAILLVVAFGGKVTALIPLYAIGVFTGFTLSQTGMCVHHWRHRDPRWKFHLVVNGIGALTTFSVVGVVVVTKFTDGAWLPVFIIPLLVVIFKLIKRHYVKVRAAVAVEPGYKVARKTHLVIVLVGAMNRGSLNAIAYAKSLAPDRLIALTVAHDDEEAEHISQQWIDYGMTVKLDIIHSPFRELSGVIMNRIDELDAEDADDIVTVVIPEFVTDLRTQWLHNNSAFTLKAKLLYRPNTVVTSVPVVVD
jgi:amino acid transporter